jgi:hypothetical protein
MLMTKERRSAIGTLQGWAISALQEAGAIRECEEHGIRECEEHGWMRDRGDPHARDRALDFARENPPSEVSPQAAAVAVAEVLDY